MFFWCSFLNHHSNHRYIQIPFMLYLNHDCTPCLSSIGFFQIVMQGTEVSWVHQYHPSSHISSKHYSSTNQLYVNMGPQLTSVYMAVYFRFLHFGFIFFLLCELFLNSCIDSQKRDFWGPYLWTLDIQQYYVPISSKHSRHAPGNSACRRKICGVRDLWLVLSRGKGNWGGK